MMRQLAAAIFCFALASTSAWGTVLLFTIDGVGNSGSIPVAYGDHVSAVDNGALHYAAGNGLTPHVGIGYSIHDVGTTANIGPQLRAWDTAYGDLLNVAWAGCANCYGEIILTADPGWNVRLNSFDEGGWPATNQSSQSVHVFPSTGAPLLLNNITILGAGPAHSSFTPNMTAQSITIDFAFNNVSVGIDNVNFDQVALPGTAPEPSTLLLAGVALALGGLRRLLR